ncbi:uncharacterized protein LOC108831210 isoform X1 [Raphanus sativus]|uniref:Uncharacterized protein LOC108831210 isoform X1 n=1 Tax=Raphanus sativus TaxID=3726 RepID=A0A9W3BWH1_RAPSA|nr:uncharacterized protein LOC108831210 isoform X1 [Raphanus sativus]XP_056843639.1 uncharacterized protein LOC108831210 isoform X1 [Raphanus sativus]XP_056843640.1 uncharacterized protein LOC108831210 isoform X1 [Raphanus sativus]XP_056843641.1 uncharacterized protein LOC108831210 isoform X1 [Raphanus sativus]XP_056843642.1 uncharacterized protein LOC108831210 isoform X1 [Raphanus sativus]
MEEAKGQRGNGTTEADFVLQWGERKRVRCMKVKKDQSRKSTDCLSNKRKLMSRAVSSERGSPSRHLNRPNKMVDSTGGNVRRSFVASPEKEDRYYTTRGSMGTDESGKIIKETVKETKKHVWPKLFITLSNKEKEEDFLAMKGCKLPQRPKKRAKLVQKTLLLVSPGTWLSDLCKERYEVREKKTSKKATKRIEGNGEHGKRFRVKKKKKRT